MRSHVNDLHNTFNLGALRSQVALHLLTYTKSSSRKIKRMKVASKEVWHEEARGSVQEAGEEQPRSQIPSLPTCGEFGQVISFSRTCFLLCKRGCREARGRSVSTNLVHGVCSRLICSPFHPSRARVSCTMSLKTYSLRKVRPWQDLPYKGRLDFALGCR